MWGNRPPQGWGNKPPGAYYPTGLHVYSNYSYYRPSSVFHLPKNKVAYLYRASKLFYETYTHATGLNEPLSFSISPVHKETRHKDDDFLFSHSGPSLGSTPAHLPSPPAFLPSLLFLLLLFFVLLSSFFPSSSLFLFSPFVLLSSSFFSFTLSLSTSYSISPLSLPSSSFPSFSSFSSSLLHSSPYRLRPSFLPPHFPPVLFLLVFSSPVFTSFIFLPFSSAFSTSSSSSTFLAFLFLVFLIIFRVRNKGGKFACQTDNLILKMWLSARFSGCPHAFAQDGS